MPQQPFHQVPDWFSFDNQGGGIAVGRVGGASADLVVVAVDGGPQQNRGLLRVGRALDADGVVTGGWSPWVDVPDWFSWTNQGAGVALADLSGDGTQDVLVAMVDAGPEQNRGLFRVGRGLTPAGVVSGAWSPWIDVPDWDFWENQGIAVAVRASDVQGRQDLIVCTVDNPVGPNRGLFRIGRGLDADGGVQSWSPWREVDDWFSWENQACGVSVLPPDAGAAADLVFFQIDNAAGQNQAFYKIARDVDDDGEPAGWDRWRGVPFWTSWENQGGGIAAVRLGGERKLLAFMVDAPPGVNTGGYEVLDLDVVPARHGSWQLLPFLSGVLAVHAALLPGGKVLFFAGSGSSNVRFSSPRFGNENEGIFTSVVWDPPGDSFTHPATLRTPDGRPFDFFCGGDALLPDGRMLQAGGTLAYEPGFKGRADAAVFDPATGAWSFTGPMQHGRWYPTLVTVGDGRVAATTGLTETGTDHNQGVELFDPATGTWEPPRFFQPGFAGLPLYAHLFLLADGRVFFSGGRMDDDLPVQPSLLDLTADPITAQPVPDLLEPDFRNQSASVLLGPAQDQRVMICGGGPVGKPDKTDAVGAVSIVDLGAAGQPGADLHFVDAAPLGLPRLHLNAVLLPDRTVYVGGGSLKQEDQPLARLEPEIYDPVTGNWTLMAAAGVPRLYHSTALLLPDATVLAAGGNPEGGGQVDWIPPDDEEELRLEIFSPPYLFRGPRPSILAAPDVAGHGDELEIATPQAASLRWVSLVRNGVTTHSFDSGQRLVDLPITARAAGSVTVIVPDNPNLAPPGSYMLFLVDSAGVPSVASWLRLEL